MFFSVEQTVSQTLSRSVLDTADEITVTHLPNKTLYQTISCVRKLKETVEGYQIVPHIAARNIASDKELIECANEFKNLGIEKVLVIGGNLKQGRYYQSVYQVNNILKDWHFEQMCGVYPDRETFKQVSAKNYSTFSEGITQFCLNTKRLNQFTAKTRIGVPSMCAMKDLYKYMRLCGVGNSIKTAAINMKGVQYLSTKGFDTAKFASRLTQLKIHVYNFGKIESTVAALRDIA
jgi:5,10-methylenetetrahydrofolate reductase